MEMGKVMSPSGTFFTVGERGGHAWFITPDGTPFFSIGMNHVDSATLRHPDSGDVWQSRFGNSQRRFLQEGLVPDLNAWGFNTIGWTQEVVIRLPSIHRHSPNFRYEEYLWANMPYCHLLPFTETHQWELETAYPDVFSDDFVEWCDYVARDDCSRMADDPNLIGYFYVDCPTWVHSLDWNPKGSWFDPALLESDAGCRRLADAAHRYYSVIRDAIRRYDPNHLLLGDRYEGKQLLPDLILDAASPYVDVLSFQYFAPPEVVATDLGRWHALTGKPTLLADACAPGRDPQLYAPMIRALREEPSCIGWHVCGAYLKNRARNAGFRDERFDPIEDLIAAASEANHETLRWVEAVTAI